MPDGTMRISAGDRRRRRRSAAEKLRIVAESDEPEASVNAVAARHDIRASLLSTWRRQAREGWLRPAGSSGFVPVRLLTAEEPSGAAPCTLLAATTSEVAPVCLAIILPDGSRIHISHAAQLPLLRGVLAAVRG